MSQAQKLQTQIREIESKLQQLAVKAEEENPELVEQRNEFVALYESKLEASGYPGEEEQKELQQMQMRLQNPQGMEEKARQKLTQEFQKEVRKMQAAEQKVRQDEEFRKEQEQLLEARTEAITEINPKAPEMKDKLDALYTKLSEITQTQLVPQQ
jgi:hypothetical protein